MSMIRAKYHLDEARTSIAVAINHLSKAEKVDVDPEKSRLVYSEARTQLHYVDFLCEALGKSRRPDLDRETAAIDASREADRV